MLNKLTKGYASLIKEMFFMENRGEFLKLDMSVARVFLITGLIGLSRNFMEFILGITPSKNWYTLKMDINFVMFFYPIYFCFFGAFIIHLISKKFNKEIPYKKLFSFLFHVQILHLFIPLIDFVAFAFNLPFSFDIFPFTIRNEYFFSTLYMSLGIISGWVIAFYITTKVFTKHFRISLASTLLILLISFNFMYWPIYHLFPTFNTLFNFIFGISEVDLYGNFWGYGMFFVLCSLIGVFYYKKMERIN